MSLTKCRGQEEGVEGKKKKSWYFSRNYMWDQHFHKTQFYFKSVYLTVFSSDILWVPVISVLNIQITILDNAKLS